MERVQYDLLTTTRSRLAKSEMLADRAPRTLAYGYTCDRNTFHVYLGDDGFIHKVVYSYDNELLVHRTESDSLGLDECVPDKRLYPEACDYDFCLLLHAGGVNLPFTTWSEGRRPAQYYGKCADDFVIS